MESNETTSEKEETDAAHFIHQMESDSPMHIDSPGIERTTHGPNVLKASKKGVIRVENAAESITLRTVSDEKGQNTFKSKRKSISGATSMAGS